MMGSALPTRRRLTTKKNRFGMSNSFRVRSPATMIVNIGLLLLAASCMGMARCSRDGSRDLDSELIETETGWQFEEDGIATFDNATTNATTTTAAKVSGDHIALTNGDFELTNVTGNSTVNADATTSYIINWSAGEAGVQILMKNTYNMAKETPNSMYCIHLNNPLATGNGTQGSLSTTLAAPAATGKTYTVQYDTARNPDGPINLWSALKISAIEGTSINAWQIKNPVYNMTDAQSHITWQKQSFVYTGTGAQTVIKFESMSEKYGPLLDNVQLLSGKHELAAAPPTKIAGAWQRVTPVVTLVALTLLSSPLMPGDFLKEFLNIR